MLYQLRSNLKEHGLLATSRKAWTKFVVGSTPVDPRLAEKAVGSKSAAEVLDLQPGDWVEVRSEAEILQTLDETGKNRGLGFMPEMWPYCGKRGRVMKRVEKICLEEGPRTVRSMKNTVILDGLFCKGNGIGCDRACFYFWREVWLKRVSPSDIDPETVAPSDLVTIGRRPV